MELAEQGNLKALFPSVVILSKVQRALNEEIGSAQTTSPTQNAILQNKVGAIESQATAHAAKAKPVETLPTSQPQHASATELPADKFHYFCSHKVR